MRKLNAEIKLNRTKWYDAKPEAARIQVRDRHFALDTNSLAVFQTDTPEEAVPLLDKRPQFDPYTARQPGMVVLELTHACCLSCLYCFTHDYPDSPVKVMSITTAKAAITRLLARPCGHMPQGMGVHVSFFGGEPLMAWETLKEAAIFVEGYAAPLKPSLHVTTNAVLLSEAKARWLVEHGFSLIVSLDGPQPLHDAARPMINGSGSYGLVRAALDGLKAARAGAITLRSTFYNGSTHVLERVAHLNDLCDQGYAQGVSVEPICLSETRCVDRKRAALNLTAADIEGLDEEYMSVADWAVERLRAGKRPRLHGMEVFLTRLLWTQHSPTECGAGSGVVSVAPDGEIFACFAGDTKVSLLNGMDQPIADLVAHPKPLWVYSYDGDKVVPGRATAHLVAKDQELLAVTLDNREVVRCTPDHPFMLRDGTYCRADQLASGASLMPLYKGLTARHKSHGGHVAFYESLYHPGGARLSTHQMVWEAIHGPLPKRKVVHHKDGNSRNNDPDNLDALTHSEHRKRHLDEGGYSIADQWQSQDFRKKMEPINRENINYALAGIQKNKTRWRGRLAVATSRASHDPTNGRYIHLHSGEHLARLRWYAVKSTACPVCSRAFTNAGCCGNHQRQTDHYVTAPTNHRVVSVAPAGRADVYCLEVEKYHNFALAAGVFVHNCHRETPSEIGHLDRGGIDEVARLPWCENRSYRSEICMKCAARWACGGGCRHASLAEYGSMTQPYDAGCALMWRYVRMALWIMSEVGPELLARIYPDPTAQKQPYGWQTGDPSHCAPLIVDASTVSSETEGQ